MRKDYDIYLNWDLDKNINVFSQVKEELFFRLNPHWVVTTFSCTGNVYNSEVKDHETDQETLLEGTYNIDSAGLPEISVNNQIWESISFFERNGNLHAEIVYKESPPEDDERKLVLWLKSIKEYVRLYKTNSLNTRVFRFLMNRVILQMTPSQRKISLMLIRITVLEIIAILVILLGWIFFIR